MKVIVVGAGGSSWHLNRIVREQESRGQYEETLAQLRDWSLRNIQETYLQLAGTCQNLVNTGPLGLLKFYLKIFQIYQSIISLTLSGAGVWRLSEEHGGG